jgi:uncharacterized lipoprotein YmbA
VTLFPQTLSADADYRVAIEVQRFESAPGQAATLDAVWIVRRAKDGKAQTGRTVVREAVQDENGPLFIASTGATRLDDIATRTYRAGDRRATRASET